MTADKPKPVPKPKPRPTPKPRPVKEGTRIKPPKAPNK